MVELGWVADIAGGFLAPAFVLALLAIALDLQWGHAGLFNAGIAGFFAIGAYVGAIFTTRSVPTGPGGPGHAGFVGFLPPHAIGVGSFTYAAPVFPTSLVVATVVAMVASGLIALLIAIPTLRLRADYLAIGTLALSTIIVESIRNWETVTGGVYGILGVPRPYEFGTETYKTEAAFAAFAGLILLGTLVLVVRATRAPWGRTLKAVREDENAALALGKNTYFLKVQSFVLGSMMMGGAGVLQASLYRQVFPENFAPALTFSIWVMVIVGGTGNPLGVTVGALVLSFLEYFTLRAKDWFNLPAYFEDRIFYFRLIVIGVLLIILVLLRPQGLLPESRKVSKKPRIVLGRLRP